MSTRLPFLVERTKINVDTVERGFVGNAEVALELVLKAQEIMDQHAFVGFTDTELADKFLNLFRHGVPDKPNADVLDLRDIKGELSITHYSKKIEVQ